MSETDPTQSDDADLEALEIELLTEAVFRRYGYDFRDYSYPSLRRRVQKRMTGERCGSVSELQHKVLRDSAAMERLLLDLSINVTSMFRDPSFYQAIRSNVVPLLRTYPFIRIWHAGCSTGEEVYSTAIVLHEEGLYGRCRIYATDINESVLDKARRGIYPLSSMQEYTSNYQRAGGTSDFSNYYTANYDHAIFSPALRQNMVFAQHNLVTDAAFNEFHMIVCRNVLIYFNTELQDRVIRLFYDSLLRFGVLALGKKESLRYTSVAAQYETLDADERVYRRVA